MAENGSGEVTVVNIWSPASTEPTNTPTVTPASKPDPTDTPEPTEEPEPTDWLEEGDYVAPTRRYITTAPQTIFTDSSTSRTTYITAVPQNVQTTTTAAQTAKTADDTSVTLYILLLTVASLAIMVTVARRNNNYNRHL